MGGEGARRVFINLSSSSLSKRPELVTSLLCTVDGETVMPMLFMHAMPGLVVKRLIRKTRRVDGAK